MMLPYNSTEKKYRTGVGIMLFNKKGQIWIGNRVDHVEDAWQMPQGGIDEGESCEEAALRELKEETGIIEINIIARSREWLFYDFPCDLGKIWWNGAFQGQKQLWFLMKFTGEENDITIHTPHPEFREWRWTDIDILPEIIIDFKKDIYTRIVTEFKPLIAAHIT